MIPPIQNHDLEYLGFQSFWPSPGLRKYIQCYWAIRRTNSDPLEQDSYLYPNGGTSIVFNLEGSVLVDGEERKQRYYLDSANQTVKQVNYSGDLDAIGIRFWPGGAFHFLPVMLNELNDETFALEDLGLYSAFNVPELLHQNKALPYRIRLLESWLTELLQQSRQKKATTRAAVQLLKQTSGKLSIEQLLQAVNINRRRLERGFRKELGLSPKYFARLLRCERARNLLKFHPEQSLAYVAHEAGFYDQAHFINEFKSIIRITPMAYREKKGLLLKGRKAP